MTFVIIIIVIIIVVIITIVVIIVPSVSTLVVVVVMPDSLAGLVAAIRWPHKTDTLRNELLKPAS